MVAIKRIHRAITWLLAAMVFLLPWQTRLIVHAGTLGNKPWEYGTISFYALDIVLIVLLLAAATWRAHTKKQWAQLDALVLLFAAIAFLSLGFAVDRAVGLFWWVQLLKGISLFFVIRQYRISQKMIGWSWIAAASLQSILGLIQFFAQTIPATTWLGMSAQHPSTLGVQVIETAGERILRAYGSLPHPNMLAGFLVVGIIIALVWLLTDRSRNQQLLLCSSLVLLTSGLWVSLSRQGWLALAVVCTLLMLHGFLRYRRFPVELAVGVGLIGLTAIGWSLAYPTLVTTRLGGTERLEERSIDERLNYVEQNMVVLSDNWIGGVGIGNYTAYLHDQDSSITGYDAQPVHNIYLLIFSELGVMGMITGFLLVCHLFWQRRWREIDQIVWHGVLVAILVIGLFDHYLWTLPFGIVLFWLCAGLAAQTQFDSKK